MTTSTPTAVSANPTAASVEAPAMQPVAAIGQGKPVSPAAAANPGTAKAKAAKQAKALNLDEATIACLAAIEGNLQAIRSKATTKVDREKAIKALAKAVLSLGLGVRSGGHGPLVRLAIKAVLLAMLGDEGVKVLKKDRISVDLVVKACRRKSIQSDGIKALKGIEAKLAEGDVKSEARIGKAVSPATLATRKANLAQARAWFDHAGPKLYALGWTGLKALGVSKINYSGGSFFLDRAAALALGASVTAAEVAGDEALALS
jgi:hypothetical protein